MLFTLSYLNRKEKYFFESDGILGRGSLAGSVMEWVNVTYGNGNVILFLTPAVSFGSALLAVEVTFAIVYGCGDLVACRIKIHG